MSLKTPKRSGKKICISNIAGEIFETTRRLVQYQLQVTLTSSEIYKKK